MCSFLVCVFSFLFLYIRGLGGVVVCTVCSMPGVSILYLLLSFLEETSKYLTVFLWGARHRWKRLMKEGNVMVDMRL